MSPSEECPDCGGLGRVLMSNAEGTDTAEAPCHCTKEHAGDGPED